MRKSVGKLILMNILCTHKPKELKMRGREEQERKRRTEERRRTEENRRRTEEMRRAGEENRRKGEESRRRTEERRRAGEDNRRKEENGRRTEEQGKRTGEKERRAGEEQKKGEGQQVLQVLLALSCEARALITKKPKEGCTTQANKAKENVLFLGAEWWEECELGRRGALHQHRSEKQKTRTK